MNFLRLKNEYHIYSYNLMTFPKFFCTKFEIFLINYFLHSCKYSFPVFETKYSFPFFETKYSFPFFETKYSFPFFETKYSFLLIVIIFKFYYML